MTQRGHSHTFADWTTLRWLCKVRKRATFCSNQLTTLLGWPLRSNRNMVAQADFNNQHLINLSCEWPCAQGQYNNELLMPDDRQRVRSDCRGGSSWQEEARAWVMLHVHSSGWRKTYRIHFIYRRSDLGLRQRGTSVARDSYLSSSATISSIIQHHAGCGRCSYV